MKFTAAILLATAAIMGQADAHNAVKCASKHINYWLAIGKFCNTNGITVPSDYANHGATNNGHLVMITGDCT